MTRSILAASLGATLGLALLGGCATVNMPGGDSGLVEQVRQELATDPMLNTSRVTVTERDGVIVIGGFAESLEDINVIRDTVQNVEDVVAVENNVIVQTDEDLDGPDDT